MQTTDFGQIVFLIRVALCRRLELPSCVALVPLHVFAHGFQLCTGSSS